MQIGIPDTAFVVTDTVLMEFVGKQVVRTGDLTLLL